MLPMMGEGVKAAALVAESTKETKDTADLVAQIGSDYKQVRHISANDYEAQKLWRDVAISLIEKTDQENVILAADAVAKAYINFVNSQENN